ncbi:MAG TPA: carbonic anhydrase family protein, partial [Nitrospira sp.]|nr:carbonic anhydrase family protein [Nitrospira sp.]
MKDEPGSSRVDLSIDRRSVLAILGGAATVGLLRLVQGGNLAYALTSEEHAKITPDEIIAQAKKGNERFLSGKRKERDLLREQKNTAKDQYPEAIVLSCIDSRAPVELILDLGIGDTFNSRVAGNIANEDILGSMEYACAVAGSKPVLVMGHTACGARKGAVDQVQLGNLTGLLEKIRQAIEATQYDGDRTTKNSLFVNAIARKNVELTMAGIRARSPVLKKLEDQGHIKIAGAMYSVETGVVEFI